LPASRPLTVPPRPTNQLPEEGPAITIEALEPPTPPPVALPGPTAADAFLMDATTKVPALALPEEPIISVVRADEPSARSLPITSAPTLPPAPSPPERDDDSVPPRTVMEPPASAASDSPSLLLPSVGPSGQRRRVRKAVWVGAGAVAIVLAIALVGRSRSTGHSRAAAPTSDSPAQPTPKPAATMVAAAPTAARPAEVPAAAAPSSAQPPLPPSVPAPPPSVPEPPPAATRATSAGDAGHDESNEPARPALSSLPRRHRHRVVLEYDPRPHSPEPPPAAPAPPGADPDKVQRARESYHRGNWNLFIGKTGEAISAYRETLSIYPGYVAGYRGLGLAYAQEGKRDEAVTALRRYVTTVPTARDVPLLKKRIERLLRP
jgi:hypothetical protein